MPQFLLPRKKIYRPTSRATESAAGAFSDQFTALMKKSGFSPM